MKARVSIFLAIALVSSLSSARISKKNIKQVAASKSRKPSQAMPCARYSPGSIVQEPTNLFSKNGTLELSLAYESNVDEDGNTQFCYRTPSGDRSPTLHINPGDRLVINLTNKTSAKVSGASMQMHADTASSCGPGMMMDESTTNIHFHGANVPPTCHQDEAIHTMVNAGQSFTYSITFPKNEPPGLYWYHPHIHGVSEGALLGGASGAIVVEGIQHLQRKTAALRERVLILRDNLVPGNPKADDTVPSWDISLNYVPIPYPKYTPAIIQMRPEKQELWRVLNASADSILDLQLKYDGVVQSVEVVGLDGVPVGSQEDNHISQPISKDHIFLAPASRAEFIVRAPGINVRLAVLSTLKIATGEAGDSDPARSIAQIQTSKNAPLPPVKLPHKFVLPFEQRFEGTDTSTISKKRKLYFSEVLSDPDDKDSPTDFFITVDDKNIKPKKFDIQDPPAVIATQGDFEEWVIENRSRENHEFHIHQIHFLLTERNGTPVAKDDRQFLDTVDVPSWSGEGPFPSVTVRMDFRGDIVGDFVYHCHILGHEDNGMMAMIRVLPKTKEKK